MDKVEKFLTRNYMEPKKRLLDMKEEENKEYRCFNPRFFDRPKDSKFSSLKIGPFFEHITENERH